MSTPSSQSLGNLAPVNSLDHHGMPQIANSSSTTSSTGNGHGASNPVELDTVLAAVAVLKDALAQSDLTHNQPYLKQHLTAVEQFAQALQGSLKVSMAGSVQKLFRLERERLRKIVQPMQSATTIDQLFKATVSGLGETLRVSRVVIYRCVGEDQGKVMVEALAAGWTPTKNEVLPLSFFGFDRGKFDQNTDQVFEQAPDLNHDPNHDPSQGTSQAERPANPEPGLPHGESNWSKNKHQVRVLTDVNAVMSNLGQPYGEYFVNGSSETAETQGSAAIKIAAVSPYQKQLYEKFQVQALMAVPILFGTANGTAGYAIDPLTEQDLTQMEMWGILCVHQCDRPRQWQEMEISLLQQVSRELTLCLQPAEFRTQLRVRTDQERLVGRVVNKLYQAGSIQHLFNTVVREIRRSLAADRVTIFQFHPDSNYQQGQFVAEEVVGGYISTMAAPIHDAQWLADGLSAYQEGQCRAVSDITVRNALGAFPDGPATIDILSAYGVRANLVVPLLEDRVLWGVLCVQQCSGPRQWKEMEIDLVRQIAAQFTFTLQHADSVEQIQRQAQQLTGQVAAEKTAQALLKDHIQAHAGAVVRAMQQLPLTGDLTVRAPVTDEEIGIEIRTIATAYNNTLQTLQQVIAQIQGTAADLTTMTDSSLQRAQDLAQRPAPLPATPDTLSQLQDLVAAFIPSSDQTQTATSAITQAETTRQQGDTAMGLALSNMATIDDTVTDLAHRVQTLSESSQKILRVLQLISNFASQTNLLALNASLEATRAGEYGRGFVIVADELRALARQSVTAMVEIEKLVLEIQTETTTVAAKVNQGLVQVREGNHLVTQNHQHWTEISAVSGAMANLLQDLMQMSQSQAAQTQLAEFTATINTVMEFAHNLVHSNSEAAQVLTDSLQELLTTAQHLQTKLAWFKLDQPQPNELTATELTASEDGSN